MIDRRDFLKAVSAGTVAMATRKGMAKTTEQSQQISRAVIATDPDSYEEPEQIQAMVDNAIMTLVGETDRGRAYEALFHAGVTANTRIAIKTGSFSRGSRADAMDAALRNGLRSMLGGTFSDSNIIFSAKDTTAATGNPTVTMNRVSAVAAGTVFLLTGVLRAIEPQQVYDLSDDLVMLEAEDLPHNDKWQMATAHAGYTGRGYLVYVGPEMSCWYWDSKGEPVNADTNGSCQRAREDRLYLPVYIKNPGLYNVNIHNYHSLAPQHMGQVTDFSVWIHMDGEPLPVMLSHGDNAGRWAWLRWGPDYPDRPLNDVPYTSSTIGIRKAGVYQFYIAGRNRNFCVDRISIYRKLGINQFPQNCLSLTEPVSELVDVSEFGETAAEYSIRPASGTRHGCQTSAEFYNLVGRRLDIEGTTAPRVVLRVSRTGGFASKNILMP